MALMASLLSEPTYCRTVLIGAVSMLDYNAAIRPRLTLSASVSEVPGRNLTSKARICNSLLVLFIEHGAMRIMNGPCAFYATPNRTFGGHISHAKVDFQCVAVGILLTTGGTAQLQRGLRCSAAHYDNTTALWRGACASMVLRAPISLRSFCAPMDTATNVCGRIIDAFGEALVVACARYGCVEIARQYHQTNGTGVCALLGIA